MNSEQPLGITQYDTTQAEKYNELGLELGFKILKLYQEIDRLKDEVNFWKEKYLQTAKLRDKYR